MKLSNATWPCIKICWETKEENKEIQGEKIEQERLLLLSSPPNKTTKTRTRVFIPTAARGLCHPNINMHSFGAFAKTTDYLVFLRGTVSHFCVMLINCQDPGLG